MTCVYTFADGTIVTGRKALKEYLAQPGVLARLLPEHAANIPSFRRTAVQSAVAKVANSEQTAMVERMANGIAGRWANPPKVEFFHSLQDANIPEAVREEDARQRKGGATGDPEGFYYGGKVYVWYGLKKPEDVARVTFHEGLGHYGLRGVFGQTLKSELEQIVALRKKDVLARAAKYGFDTNNPAAMLKAAEEVLAFMAQNTPEIGFVKRAIAAIKTWLRQNVPGMSNLQLSDAEVIRDYILPARNWVERGESAMKPGGKVAFLRAYHGTPHRGIQKFSTDKIGTGEGAQAYGWGLYFASQKDIAEWYREKLAGETIARVEVEEYTIAGDRNWVAETYNDAGDRITRTGYLDDSELIDLIGKDAEKIIAKAEEDAGSADGEYEVSKTPGQLYEVEIPEDNEYLLWDKPLSEQSEKVQNAVDDAIRTAPGADETIISRFESQGMGMTGEEIYKLLAGRQLELYGQRGASEHLASHGIKGIKYLDGTSRADGDGSYNYVIFSGDDVEIQQTYFSRTQTPTGLTPDEQGKLRKTQAEFQDNNNRIKQVQARIAEITGEKVPEYADYYQAESNRPGRIAARLQDFREKMRAPLVQRIAKSGHTLAQVEELAHAMHALERNPVIARINPKHDPNSKEFIGVEGSGMNTDVAQKIIAKHRADRALQKHVSDLQAIARATLEIKLASGMLTAEQYDAYTNAYDFYVPLKGDGEYGPQVKRAMGHEGRDEHIMENVMRDYEQAVVTTERNLARQYLLQLVLKNPDSKLWTVGVTPKGRYVAGQMFTIVKDGEEVAAFASQAQVDAFMEAKGAEAYGYEVLDERGEKVREFAKPLQPNEVPVYINGQRVRIQIKDETLAGQLRPMNQKQMNWVLQTFSDVQRYLSRIYTAYSPTFIITNPLRDVQTGSINMLGNQGAGVTAKAWTKYPGALKALAAFAATGKEPTGETGRMLKEYRMNGGKTGASHMSDLEEQGKTLQRLFDDAYGAKGYLADGKVGKAAWIAGRKMLMGMAHVIEVTNQATENALRLALYITLREGGATPGQAAQAAKNVTVNFDRKGNQTGVMSALYLFFNPAVQGTANALRTLTKGEHKKQAWAALGGLALLGMWAAGQGIDDDEDRWLGEGWEVRSKKLVMNIGGKKIVVPLSLEFAPFFAAGVALEEARRGAVTATEASGRLMSSFIEAYVPFRGLFSYDSDNKPLDAVTAVVPTVLRPAIESTTNRNAFGSKIVPESDFTKDRPDNLKMNRNTKGTMFDSAAQGIASAGEAMGAGRYENDITKVSPETLKHWWRTYTGGLGTFIADMGSLGKMAAQDASVIEMADVPVVKAFAKGQDVSPIRGRFYDLAKEARAASTEFKQAKAAGDSDAMDAILNSPKKSELLGLERMIIKTTSAAAALRDEMVDINADTELSLAEKRAKLKELEKEEEALYRDAIEAFR